MTMKRFLNISFDPKCYDLAEAFLMDSPEKYTPENCTELAKLIQTTIEDALEYQLKPDGGPRGLREPLATCLPSDHPALIREKLTPRASR